MNKPIFSEKELFKLVASGDTQAFERLFRLYYPVMVRVLMRYSRDPEQIKGWIQEILLSFRKTTNQPPYKRLRTAKLIYIVSARNHVIRLLNKKAGTIGSR